MARMIIGFSQLLMIVGVVAYFATGRESLTSLLPALAGLVILLAGILASRPQTRISGEYAAVALTILLAIGTLRGVFILLGGDVTTGSVVNTGLFVISVIFVVYAVRRLRTSR